MTNGTKFIGKKKILSGFNTALKLRSVSGRARTGQIYQLGRDYQRLCYIEGQKGNKNI